MEQIRLKATALIALSTFAINANAGYRVVYDPWTTAQVVANAGEQKLIEDKHNERLDTISAKQQKILQYTATMESIKELYRLSMTNIRGFGQESAYYKEIVQLSADILTGIPTVTKFLVKHPGKNYILCLNELTNVMAETEGLVSDFVNIVNNGKVTNPLKKKGTYKCTACGSTNVKMYNSGKENEYLYYVCQKCGQVTQGNPASVGKNEGDGYNFLDRYTRVSLTYRIYGRLLEIKYRMDAMVMMCRFGTWNDVFFHIDPKSWASYYQASNSATMLINKWNYLSI